MLTGMPAATAFLISALRAPLLASVSAIPLTLLSIAAWMSWACFAASGSLEYWRLTLSFAAAAAAPLRMMSQKVSPGAAWVIIWMVIFGVLAVPALAALLLLLDFPPLVEQAARERADRKSVVQGKSVD